MPYCDVPAAIATHAWQVPSGVDPRGRHDPPHERDDRQTLAAGETYLIHVLETSDPPGNPDHYRITDAVEAHHASTGSYDVEAGGLDAARELLARHAT